MDIPQGLRAKLQQVITRHEELAALMASPDVTPTAFTKMSREYGDLEDVVTAVRTWQSAEQELNDLEAMMADPEMRDMAEHDLYALKDRIPDLYQKLLVALLPKDEADSRNAILEIRAGTGGDEAGLFAADLLSMYRSYASYQGWRFEVMDISESDLGGLKEATVSVVGEAVFSKLKFESGVHRVQRVPKTEASGRIHTSAATVAVLPEVEEVDVKIDEKDLRVDVYRAGGAGGQHVNKTESAVRITHIPTGIVVAMQDERSQHKNRDKAMKILRARLYEGQRESLARDRALARKEQVGSGDRSERIRTYNFPQSRITDHRINLTLYKLDEILAGKALDELIEPLRAQDQADRLASFA